MKPKKKLSSVLLVDDNVATNLIHQKLIERQNFVDRIYTCTSATQALSMLSSPEEAPDAIDPELIFLDINMPGMDGWDFLERYHELNTERKRPITLYMLTTSINPDDRAKAEMDGMIAGLIIKPLSANVLTEIVERHFVASHERE